ncbi:MAG TPA: hypothetical protein VJ672_11470, partial [Gemmatimonadaceae bacterium]|nr:hypothetical protein [Gemmatimonadaceae bacterium]
AAYVLQARIFASGQWVAPPRPLPGFFEQMAVFGEPLLVPKYPPGHALLLVPGIWLGLPGLGSVVLSGVAGAMLFALARRLAGPWVAILTWLIWLTAPGNLQWRASYLSQMTTSAAWLVGWWCLSKWRDAPELKWACGVALCVAWCAITRPLTAIAYAIPIAIVMIRLTSRRRTWRQLAVAGSLGMLVLAVVPLWSARTIGDWRTTPYTLYMRTFIPTERLGFGMVEDAPLRVLPPDLARVDADWRRVHAMHTMERLPITATFRMLAIGRGAWGGWRATLVLFFLVGLTALTGAGWLALASGALLLGTHLVFAHPSVWWPYYLELLPVLAFVTATGVWRVLTRTAEASRAIPAAAALAAGAILLSAFDSSEARRNGVLTRAAQERFNQRIATIPDSGAIVFVRYAPTHDHHRSLVVNDADLERQRIWVVYDRGVDNERLRRLAPTRAAYLYDEASDALMPLAPERAS